MTHNGHDDKCFVYITVYFCTCKTLSTGMELYFLIITVVEVVEKPSDSSP